MAASNSPAEQLITENIDIWTSAIKKRGSQGRGSSKKIELYGIVKLRELILELAVRGLLVPQDPNDEPASVLLEKIAAEKEQLIKDGKIKKQKALPEISEDEKPFELPDGWAWARLNNVAAANTGYAFKSSEYVTEGTFVLRVTNIDPKGTINTLDNKYIESYKADSVYEKFKLKKDDVLLVMVGGSLGKIGVVSDDVLPAVLNQNMWRINKFTGIELRYFTMGLEYINRNQLTITKSTHGHLAQGDYLSKLFPTPPQAEQTRIVAKVDELMALCDQLEQQTETSHLAHQTLVETLLNTLLNADQNSFDPAWERIAQHFDVLFTTEHSIDQLKQTILQLAVMGKLVPQDPNDEPASVLLEKIAAEKEQLIKDKVIKKQKPLPPISEDEKPFALPKGWEWVRLGDALSKITDGTHHSPLNSETGDYLYISAKNIKENGVLLSNATYVAAEAHNEIYSRCDPVYGDVLYIKDGATTGIATINDIKEPFSMLSSVALLKCPRGLLNSYLLTSLRSPYFYDEMRAGMSGVAITRVTLKKLNNAFICLPPENEQFRIVKKVTDLMNFCDDLKEKLGLFELAKLHIADAMAEQALNS